MKSTLTSGKIAMADLAGDDAILKATATNEEDTVTAYERGSTQTGIAAELQQICSRAHADEVRRICILLVDACRATRPAAVASRSCGFPYRRRRTRPTTSHSALARHVEGRQARPEESRTARHLRGSRFSGARTSTGGIP